MNLVLDDAEELALKDKSRKKLGTFFVPFFFFSLHAHFLWLLSQFPHFYDY
jgi:hypothetical protein